MMTSFKKQKGILSELFTENKSGEIKKLREGNKKRQKKQKKGPGPFFKKEGKVHKKGAWPLFLLPAVLF
jgi:hypothetical protein